MKKTLLPLLLMAGVILSVPALGQNDVYTVSSGEMIFSWSDATFTQDFMTQYQGAEVVDNPVRFTVFLHFGQYLHIDFSDRVGIYTGLGVRNVGMITNETLPTQITGSTELEDYKIVRRQYMLGLPLALKLGSFSKDFYFFGGGEIEWAFVFKQKYWNSFERSGEKMKYVDWFGSQTPSLIPSVFGGVQLPGGLNVKFKYYLTDFLDNTYNLNKNNTGTFNVGDLTRYESTPLMYVSVCYQIRFDK